MRAMLLYAALSILCPCLALAADPWPGVDEAVVEKIASEHGREATAIFPWIDGDLLLFMFLIAGVVGGFAAGYYYRVLTEKPGAPVENRQ